MLERLWQASDDLKPEILPYANSSFVGAHDKVELNRAIAAGFCVFERMRTHGSRNAAAARPGSRHVPAVCDMRSAPRLIGPQVVRTQDLPLGFRDEYLVIWCAPVSKAVAFRHVRRQRVRTSLPNARLKDAPDGGFVAIFSSPNRNHGVLHELSNIALGRLIAQVISLIQRPAIQSSHDKIRVSGSCLL